MLDGPGADPAVGLPEPDSVVITSRGQNDWVAAHRPLVHIHGFHWQTAEEQVINYQTQLGKETTK